MKLIAFHGSPRKGGNTETLLAAVLKGAEQAGAGSELIRLCDLDISPCLSCGGCDQTGECVVADGMTPLYEKIIAADRIILASPIFFYGITAQAKAFVDRNQALWNRKRLLKEKGEWPDDTGRRGLLVAVAATRGAKVFDGAVLTARYAFEAMGVRYAGEFTTRGIDKIGEMAAADKILREAEEAGRNFIKAK